jgi:hypothetical protein
VELSFVQSPIGANAAAQIDAKGLHLIQGPTDVLRVKSARQKHGHIDLLPNLPAHCPVMRATRSAQFFHGGVRIAGVQ